MTGASQARFEVATGRPADHNVAMDERDNYRDEPDPLPTPWWVKDFVYPTLAAVTIVFVVITLCYVAILAL
jgi:hypothetical protein